VYWPISVAFEFVPEEVNIDNLTDTYLLHGAESFLRS